MSQQTKLMKALGMSSAIVCLPSEADSVSLPPLALGNASFMDAVSGPGMLVELPAQIYRSNTTYDAQGHALPGTQKVRSTTVLPHFSYISSNTVLGANYGAEVLLPLVHLDLEIDQGPDGRRTRQGDVIVSPLLLQWAPRSVFGRPYWQRLNFVFSLPTGSYSADSQINTGSNVWVFNPHYVFTWELTDRLEVSGRFHYAWSSRNNDPASALQAGSTQPGEAFHGNLAVSYAVSEAWRVGVAGYQLKQIGDDRIDGHRQADSREKVVGIGPGVMYQRGKQTLFANLYFESGAENRPQGTQLTLRYLHAF